VFGPVTKLMEYLQDVMTKPEEEESSVMVDVESIWKSTMKGYGSGADIQHHFLP